ncbi:MAG TPA: hypothetical protein PK493_21160, partial [Pseudomonadota bacterium]|nr:hypothetical protein [Pseudomonadota bacterium]
GHSAPFFDSQSSGSPSHVAFTLCAVIISKGILLTVRLCRERGDHRDQKESEWKRLDQHFAK